MVGKALTDYIFSGEKLFCTEQCYNAKNYVVYSARLLDDITENLRTVKSFQNMNSVMI